MTIACWGNPNQTNAANVCVNVGVLTGTHRNQIQFNNTGTVFAFSIGSAGQGEAFSSQNYSANTWSHVCCVFLSSTSRTVYLNGTAGTTNTTNCGSQNTADSILIGARANPAIGNYMNGLLSEIGIWNTDLTTAEINSLSKGMTCDKVRPQSLVFYAPLIRDLIDAKGRLTITNNNTATVATHPRVYA
jgi:hypothetical protein